MTSMRTTTSGSTRSIRILGGSIPKSRMSKVDWPSSRTVRSSTTSTLSSSSHWRATPAEGEVAAHPVAVGAVDPLDGGEHAVDRRVALRVDALVELAVLQHVARRRRSTANDSLPTGGSPKVDAVAVGCSVQLDEALEPIGHRSGSGGGSTWRRSRPATARARSGSGSPSAYISRSLRYRAMSGRDFTRRAAAKAPRTDVTNFRIERTVPCLTQRRRAVNRCVWH